jgi:uncharacterized membrane protein
MEQNQKPWWQSKTVWGGLVAVGAGIAGLFGLDLDAQAQGALAEHGVAIASAIGGLLAVYGRVKANSKVGK